MDLGNVLVHFSHDRMCRQIAAVCGTDVDEIHRRLFDMELQARFERGHVSGDDYRRLLTADLKDAVNCDELRKAGSDIFSLNSPMPGILDTLRSRGFRLVLLSNISVWHFDWVRDRFDVLDRFDEIVASYRVGAMKPEPAIFEEALLQIDCDPPECFYTDDIEEYVTVGRSFGFRAAVFTDAPSFLRDLAGNGVDLGQAFGKFPG